MPSFRGALRPLEGACPAELAIRMKFLIEVVTVSRTDHLPLCECAFSSVGSWRSAVERTYGRHFLNRSFLPPSSSRLNGSGLTSSSRATDHGRASPSSTHLTAPSRQSIFRLPESCISCSVDRLMQGSGDNACATYTSASPTSIVRSPLDRSPTRICTNTNTSERADPLSSHHATKYG